MDLKSFMRAQKAIPAHPALLNHPNVPVVSTGPTRTRTAFGQKEAERHLQAYGGKDDAIDWVMNCVRLIVETASSADWYFEKDGERFAPHSQNSTPTSEDDREESKPAPLMLTKLFEEPNPYQSLDELIELTLIDYLLIGNAYWLKWRMNDAGQPLALYRLAPPFVKVVPGEFGVDAYKYQVPGHDPVTFTTDQVMHFKAPNPHSAYLGLGIIQGAARALDMELALTDTQAEYFEKKALPSLVVQTDRRVPKEVFKRLQNQLRSMYGGPRNAGALMVLEAGLKYQSIAPSAAEAQFEILTKMSRDRILALFRVPGSLLGIQDANSSNQATDDQRIFDTKTMRPLLNKFQDAISRNITQSWDGMKFRIDYDYIMPVQDRLRLASTFAAIPGVRVREIREYAGLAPLGDPVIDEMVLNLPGEDAEAGEHPEIADYNQVNEQGRPPNPSNTSAFPANGSIPAGAAARRTSLAAGRKSYVDSTAEEVVTETIGQKIERLKQLESSKAAQSPVQPDGGRTDLESRIIPPDDTLYGDRTMAVDTLVAELAADIKDAIHDLERGLLDTLNNAYEGKAPGDRLRSKLRASGAWEGFLERLSGLLEKASRTSVATAALQQSREGRVPDEQIDYDAIAREIVYRKGGVRKITQNLKSEVAQKVAKALKEGESKADLELAIREAMDFWRESHAETVAMTEAVHAYNEGVLTTAEMTGHTHVYVFDGEDDDEPCINANGRVWEIDHARDNRLEHPRCRRAFTPVSVPEVA